MSDSPGTIGDSLPTFEVQPGPVQLFLFSAVTWNPHRIHYDAPYTTNVEKHPSLVVHGPLLGAWVLELAQAWLEPWGELVFSEYRNISSAFADDKLTVSGTVTDDGDSPTASVVVTRADGTVVCEGSVGVRRRTN